MYSMVIPAMTPADIPIPKPMSWACVEVFGELRSVRVETVELTGAASMLIDLAALSNSVALELGNPLQ
jgi:hypothetical protein